MTAPSSRVKRAADVVLAAVGLVATAPILAVAAAAVRVTMGPGVLFRQVRPGYQEQPFTVYKLRTLGNMSTDDGSILSDIERITPIGRFLRATSIDELPQLWNVIRGDMSLVGPRPLLTKYLAHYDTEQRRRHDAKPGLTGLAQVNRRTATTWDERLALDVWYVDHWSLRLDLLIVLRTLRELVSGGSESAISSLSRTTENELEFRGTSRPIAPALGSNRMPGASEEQP
jgi:lipopolysaccharide/colanic/teichoic acid biosynthesis glycosyltransferase